MATLTPKFWCPSLGMSVAMLRQSPLGLPRNRYADDRRSAVKRERAGEVSHRCRWGDGEGLNPHVAGCTVVHIHDVGASLEGCVATQRQKPAEPGIGRHRC